MKLTRVSDPCDGPDGCPTVDAADRRTAVITGRQLSPEELARLNLASGENAVEIPIAVYLSGAAGLEEWR
ncbi:MAG: hypothetical protein ACRDZ4_03175 [Egibacteraceae bacterium]